MTAAECMWACDNDATHQPLFRKEDGTHYLGTPACDDHRTPVGYRPAGYRNRELVDHVEVVA